MITGGYGDDRDTGVYLCEREREYEGLRAAALGDHRASLTVRSL